MWANNKLKIRLCKTNYAGGKEVFTYLQMETQWMQWSFCCGLESQSGPEQAVKCPAEKMQTCKQGAAVDSLWSQCERPLEGEGVWYVCKASFLHTATKDVFPPMSCCNIYVYEWESSTESWENGERETEEEEKRNALNRWSSLEGMEGRLG